MRLYDELWVATHRLAWWVGERVGRRQARRQLNPNGHRTVR